MGEVGQNDAAAVRIPPAHRSPRGESKRIGGKVRRDEGPGTRNLDQRDDARGAEVDVRQPRRRRRVVRADPSSGSRFPLHVPEPGYQTPHAPRVPHVGLGSTRRGARDTGQGREVPEPGGRVVRELHQAR